MPKQKTTVIFTRTTEEHGYLTIFGTHKYSKKIHGRVELELLQQIGDDQAWPEDVNKENVTKFWSNEHFTTEADVVVKLRSSFSESSRFSVPAMEFSVQFPLEKETDNES